MKRCREFVKSALCLVLLSSSGTLLGQDKSSETQKKSLEAEIQKLQSQLEQSRAQYEALQAELSNREKAIRDTQVKAQQSQDKALHRLKQVQEALNRAQIEKAEAKLNSKQQVADLLKSVESTQGRHHAYANAIRDQLSAETVRLQAELARSTAAYGPKHPRVQELMQKLNAMKAELAVVLPPDKDADQAKRLKEQGALKNRLAYLRKAEEALKGDYEGHLKKYMSQIAQDRAKLETKLKLAEKEAIATLQDQRTSELIEMQNRLKRSLELVSRDYYLHTTGAASDAAQAKAKTKAADVAENQATNKRFDRLEQKLDRIAALLEKLVGRQEE